ncbi:MAG: flavodoxin family protein [Peptoniphilus harei]|nr:flavodoxin family protein [Peptoniphilus harei]MDU2110311.1 flavodoxin family protein [Peptoniphilus lacydonensis]
MKKILFIVGSNNKNSFLNRLAYDVVNNLKGRNICNIIFLSEMDIKYCVGCRNCFSDGVCILDKKDDISEIDNMIIQSDVIILLSPVYFDNVPGKLKSLIDRFSYRAHLLRYSGKLGYTIVTTFNSGEDIVDEYLKKFVFNIGIRHIHSFKYVERELNYNEFINNVNSTILKTIDKKLNYSYELEQIFKIYKQGYSPDILNLYKKLNFYPNNEIEFWTSSFIKKISSFNEFVIRNKLRDFSFDEDKLLLEKLKEVKEIFNENF